MQKIKNKVLRSIKFSIVSSILLALLKGITGVLGNSFALIADAIESTADIFSSILVWFGLRYAMRPADENHPYGHGKIEPLLTFVVVGFLFFSAVFIAHESINNIQTPHEAPESYTLYILGIIIIIKEVSYRFLSKTSKETGSTSLKADAWHHRSDAITSLAAFIGILIAVIMGDEYAEADDWAALVASGFIMVNAYLIFRPALGEVMDENLHDDMVEEVRKLSLEIEGVVDTEKCNIRKSGMQYFIDLHLLVDGSISVEKGHDIAHRVKDHLMAQRAEIVNILIHVEPHA